MRYVISLSSIPPRFGMLGPALNGLLAQKARPEAIELYIPRSYRRFPEWGGGLPEVPDGVTIVHVDEDLGPATKILPAARARRGQDIDILYVDDDKIYGPDHGRIALALRKRLPNAAICGSGMCLRRRYGYVVPPGPTPRMLGSSETFLTLGHQWRRFLRALRKATIGPPPDAAFRMNIGKSGYTDIAEGFGGVLVRPDFFDDAAYDIPPIIWAVDDVWLSGMMARRGIPVWAERKLYRFEMVPDLAHVSPLHSAVIEGAGRHEANRACVDYMRATYGIWGGTAIQST